MSISETPKVAGIMPWGAHESFQPTFGLSAQGRLDSSEGGDVPLGDEGNCVVLLPDLGK